MRSTKIALITGIVLISTISNLFGQQVWNLKDCFNYAIDNSIALKLSRLSVQSQQEEVKRAKGNLLPNLNGSSSISKNFGRSIDPETNSISFQSNYSNSIGISSSITLFNGLQLTNRLRAQKFALKVGKAEERVQQNSLLLNIANAFYTLQLNRDLYTIAKEQVQRSEEQLNRVEKLIAVGQESKSSRIELQSRLSSAQYNKIKSENAVEQAKQDLATLLNYQDEPIITKESEITINSLIEIHPDTIFKLASTALPTIERLQNQIEVSKRTLAQNRGSLAPSISLYGGVSSAYNNQNSKNYRSQVTDNMNQYISASIQVPIFNRLSRRVDIDMAKLDVERRELELEQTLFTIYNDIKTVCLDYNAAVREYSAAEDNLKFSETAYRDMNKRFQLGLSNLTELSLAQTEMEEAAGELCRAKINIEIQRLWIDYYQTGEVYSREIR